jgi:hypothetical protein
VVVEAMPAMRSSFDVRLDKPKREGEETLFYAFDARCLGRGVPSPYVVANLLGRRARAPAPSRRAQGSAERNARPERGGMSRRTQSDCHATSAAIPRLADS